MALQKIIISGLILVFIISLSPSITQPIFAEDARTTPPYLSYQGVILDASAQPIISPLIFRFSFWEGSDYNSDTIDNLGQINEENADFANYIETQQITPDRGGNFHTLIGLENPLPELNPDLHKYLQVEVKSIGTADTEYELLDVDGDIENTNDRKLLSTAPFAMTADRVDGYDVGYNSGDIAYLDDNAKFNPSAIPNYTTESEFALNAVHENTDTLVKFGQDGALKFSVEDQHFNFNRSLFVNGNIALTDSALVEKNLQIGGKVNGRDITADGAKLDSIQDTDDQTAEEVSLAILTNQEKEEEGIRCESHSWKYQECSTITKIDNLEMTIQLSGSPCTLDETYGIKDDNTIWVDDGCRADFTVKGVKTTPLITDFDADNVQEGFTQIIQKINSIINTDDQSAEEVSFAATNWLATNVLEAFLELRNLIPWGADDLVSYQNGYLGLGTADPQNILHLFKKGQSEPQLRIGDENGFWQLWAGSNFHLRQGDDDDRIFINGRNGYVGIGTNNPQSKLHVDGEVKVGDYTLPSNDGNNGQVLKTDGQGQLSWQEDKDLDTDNQSAAEVSFSAPDWVATNVYEALVNLKKLISENNGAALTNGKILFEGDNNTGQLIRGGDPGTLSPEGGANNGLLIQSDKTIELNIDSNNVPQDMLAITKGSNREELMRVEERGNIGIGTTSPQQKLDVAGNIGFGNNKQGLLSISNDFISLQNTLPLGINLLLGTYAQFDGAVIVERLDRLNDVLAIGTENATGVIIGQNDKPLELRGNIQINDYQFPTTAGNTGQILKLDGERKLQWVNITKNENKKSKQNTSIVKTVTYSWDPILGVDNKFNYLNDRSFVAAHPGKITTIIIMKSPAQTEAGGEFILTKNDNGRYDASKEVTRVVHNKTGGGDAQAVAIFDNLDIPVDTGDALRIYHQGQWSKRWANAKATIEVTYEE